MNDALLSDAHIHYSDFAARFLAEHDVLTVISTANGEEYERAKTLATGAGRGHVFVSCGIHPWHAAETIDTSHANAILDSAIIGEIGLDNVWCSTDLDTQRTCFEALLHYAQKQRRPVAIHVKGMEAEVLTLLRRYPNVYHVHWYSCPEHLDEYLALGCYMSVGPFPSIDPAVRAVAERTPLERLLIETDGLDAARWAAGRDIAEADYPNVLMQIAQEIADLRSMTSEDVLRQTRENLLRFIHS